MQARHTHRRRRTITQVVETQARVSHNVTGSREENITAAKMSGRTTEKRKAHGSSEIEEYNNT
jgi:hypothetical protein